MTAPAFPIPVTLLTGFLGSGKTTLLNHLIRDPGMGRVAVIINEFGDIGLDHDLIEESTEEMVLLQSGCLCCTIRGDLVTAMLALLRRQALGEVAFDRAVIETTGLADPGPILHTLLIERELAAAFRLDGVVTTACAATGPRTLDAQFEAVNQLALADRIVLTKTDLVTPNELRRFEDRLAQINPGAARITADHGRVAPGVLFGISGLQAEADPAQTLAWVNVGAYAAPKPTPPAQPIGYCPRSTSPRQILSSPSSGSSTTTPCPATFFSSVIFSAVCSVKTVASATCPSKVMCSIERSSISVCAWEAAGITPESDSAIGVRLARAFSTAPVTTRWRTAVVENGSAKVCHGSGGIVLLRAE
jgi:Ni2+-binding GTPase involved in maturation of urease and hydrogenase